MNAVASLSPAEGATSPSVSPSTSHFSSRTTTPCVSALEDGAQDAHFGTATPAMEVFSSFSSLPPLMAIRTYSGPETDAYHQEASNFPLKTPEFPPLPDSPSVVGDPSPGFQSVPTPDGTLLLGLAPSCDIPAAALPGFNGPELPPLPESPLPDDFLLPSPPSLSDLSQALRIRKYQQRRRHNVENQLRTLQVSSAFISRLVDIARSSQQVLAECIRNEDKKGFATVLNAFKDVSSFCDGFDCPNGPLHIARSATKTLPVLPRTCFLDKMSASARDEILDFLVRARSDPDFVAHRIASLSQKELLAMLPDNVGPQQSVFGSVASSRGHSWPSSKPAISPQSVAERLRSLQPSSQLTTMIHLLHPMDPTSSHELARKDVWATVCARLIVEQRPGSERFVPAVLDLWSSLRDWPGKRKLELWLMRTMQEGAFLLDRPSRQSFRIRMQGRDDRSAEDDARSEQYYSQAVQGLFDCLLDNSGASLIPPGVLELAEAMSRKLREAGKYLKALPYFLVTRWLSPFLTAVITSPEAYALMTSCYLSEASRQRILREIAARVQKAIFDVVYSWRQALPVSPELVSQVERIASRFRFPSTMDVDRPVVADPVSSPLQDRKECAGVIALTANNIATVIDALYPEQKSLDGWTDIPSGLQSSASSVSGMSIFNSSVFGSSSERSSTSATDSGSSYVNIMPMPFLPQREQMEASDISPTSVPDALEFQDMQSLHTACHEMLREVAADDGVNWPVKLVQDVAVLHVSADGLRLSTSINEFPSMVVADKEGEPEIPSTSRDICRALESALSKAINLSDAKGWRAARDTATSTSTSGDLSVVDSVFDFLEMTLERCEDSSDFLSAHYFAQVVEDLEGYEPREVESAMACLARECHISAGECINAIASYESHLSEISPGHERHLAKLDALSTELNDLRCKMWYVADIRTSAVYEEARATAAALKIMGKPGRTLDGRTPPLRHWNNSRSSGQNLHLKTEAQILELMSASPAQGGPNKLSDEQAKLTAEWMRRTNIENLCVGEERLHRLCLDVRKCIDRLLGEVGADSPVLWSSELFARERNEAEDKRATPRPALHPGQSNRFTGFSPSLRNHDQFEHVARPPQSQYHPYTQPDNFAVMSAGRQIVEGNMSSTSSALSGPSSRDYFDDRSPTLTNKSSATFWSPVGSTAHSPSSATSIGSTTHFSFNDVPKMQAQTSTPSGTSKLMKSLRQNVTGLLLSDLGSQVFNAGSETDQALWHGLGGELTRRLFTVSEAYLELQKPTLSTLPSTKFDYDSAHRRLLEVFGISSNPFEKLRCLHDLERLLLAAASASALPNDAHASHSSPTKPAANFRRSQSRPDPNASVATFSDLFRKVSVRPSNLFLDLQYIASTVPSETLYRTQQGRAFCNACVAAFGLKQDICKMMVETADNIIAYHTDNRGHGRLSSVAQQQRDSTIFATPSRTPSAENIGRYTMADAAHLLQITAKEGNPAAQRELATLYLTHPELVPRIIAPFTRPRDVFKDGLESRWKKNQDPNRCDPITMCVAQHWMNLSSKGGDGLAKEYLRAREEMERLP